MDRNLKISIKTKLILILIPFLLCSFALIGYISLLSSRMSLAEAYSDFMEYKISELQNYASGQWENFQKSGLAEKQIYMEVVKKSIELYAAGMIRKESEIIFAVDNKGNPVFSTAGTAALSETRINHPDAVLFDRGPLFEFHLDNQAYIGLSAELPGFQWKIYMAENKQSFTDPGRRMTRRQGLGFLFSLFITLTGVLAAVTLFIKPLRRVRDAIRDITVNKDFSRKIRIEYPDEIGELVFEFNNMTSNLDLTYKKLRKYAIDEAVARKEVAVREKESLQILGRASDYKDPETGMHILRVSEYARILSRALGQDDSLQDLIYHASALHDIGKLGIPDSLLLKEASLTAEEFDIIKTHTAIGFRILNNSTSKYLKAGAIIALSHHERYDGAGYPKGIAGEDIPILGRIVSIIDVFDALTTKRPYKEAWPFEKAVEFIRSQRKQQFDPNITDLFLSNLENIETVYNQNRKETSE